MLCWCLRAWRGGFLVTLKRLPACGRFGFRWLRADSSSLLLWTGVRHGTGSSASWLEAFVENDDEVGGKGSHHSSISAQSSYPPRTISSIETFNQIAFDESKVLVCFSSPRIHGPAPAREAGRKVWRSRSHLFGLMLRCSWWAGDLSARRIRPLSVERLLGMFRV